MKIHLPEDWPQFYTATCYNWIRLLNSHSCKMVIINSLKYLMLQKKIRLTAFVIMDNHIHLIWQPLFGHSLSGIQLSFMKYTAQQIKFKLLKADADLIERCNVKKSDRKYQIWERSPLGIELYTPEVYQQKLDYIHNNPVKAALCKFPEDYRFSSAKYYVNGIDEFDIFKIQEEML